MMKRLYVVVFLIIVGFSLALIAPKAQGNDLSLNIYNWSTYINPEIIKEFEQKFGAKVNYDTYESSEALYAKLKPGNPGYDVIFPSDYNVSVMSKENLLSPLKLANIPNRVHVEKKFLQAPFDPKNQYSLPYFWGTMGIGYNVKKTGKPVESWEEVFNPKFNNQVALMDELRSQMGGILIYLGLDPNTTKAEDINKAKDFFIKNKKVIAAFAGDDGQDMLNRGDVAIAIEWSGDMFQVMKENPDLRYNIPKEGSVIWIDNMAIPKGAPHQELAEKFINFMLTPEIAAKNSNYLSYATPNKTALEKNLIKPEIKNNPTLNPPPEILKKLSFIKDVGEANTLYDKAWTDLKLQVSQ